MPRPVFLCWSIWGKPRGEPSSGCRPPESADASSATVPPNTSAARSISCLRHAVTWLGRTSSGCAISAFVLPSAKAWIASLALNDGACLRRGLLLRSPAPSSRALSSPIGAAVPLWAVFRFAQPALPSYAAESSAPIQSFPTSARAFALRSSHRTMPGVGRRRCR